MTKASVILKPSAEIDLSDIWFYIAIEKKSGRNANNFLDKLKAEFHKLSKTPMMGTPRDHLANNLRF